MEVKWILIGEIVATQGNKGEVRVLPHTDFPERFMKMDQVLLFRKTSSEPDLELRIEHVWMHKGFVILKLAGIDTMNQAQSLKGMQIKIDRKDVVPLPSGRHYIFDLIGLKVVTTQGKTIGVVTDVLQTSGANDIYVDKPELGITKQKEILIPVIYDVVVSVDLEQQQIVINLLDGLLD